MGFESAARCRWSWLLVTCFAVLWCSGCGQRETIPITGRVTLDGVDLPEGNIKFFYGDQLPAGVGKVQNGQFSLDCKPLGKLRVEITAVKDNVGVDPNSETQSPRMQYLPEVYNLQSTLTANVTEDGEKNFVFPLLSRPK